MDEEKIKVEADEIENILNLYEQHKIKFGVHYINMETMKIEYGPVVHMIENAFYVFLQNIKYFNDDKRFRWWFGPEALMEQEFWQNLCWEIEKSYIKNNFMSI